MKCFVFAFYSSANKCLLKVGQYAAQLERYDQAIEIYEEVGFGLNDFIKPL